MLHTSSLPWSGGSTARHATYPPQGDTESTDGNASEVQGVLTDADLKEPMERFVSHHPETLFFASLEDAQKKVACVRGKKGEESAL